MPQIKTANERYQDVAHKLAAKAAELQKINRLSDGDMRRILDLVATEYAPGEHFKRIMARVDHTNDGVYGTPAFMGRGEEEE